MKKKNIFDFEFINNFFFRILGHVRPPQTKKIDRKGPSITWTTFYLTPFTLFELWSPFDRLNIKGNPFNFFNHSESSKLFEQFHSSKNDFSKEKKLFNYKMTCTKKKTNCNRPPMIIETFDFFFFSFQPKKKIRIPRQNDQFSGNKWFWYY